MTNKSKIKIVFISFIVLSLFILSSFSVLALDEIVYSPFTQAGGWSSGSTYGRNRAFDYNDILFVANGNDIYKYDMSTWEYLGTQALTYNIYDLKAVDNHVYITQDDEVWMYTISSDGTLTNDVNDYWSFTGSTLTSFDIDTNESVIVGSSNTGTVPIVDYSTNTILRNISASGHMVRLSYDTEVVLVGRIGNYADGVYGYALSNAANLFTHSVASNYFKTLDVSPIDDQFLSGWSYGFYDYDIYQRNFSANTDAGIRAWTGYKLPHKAAYSEDGTLLTRMTAVDGNKATYLQSAIDGSSIGSFTPSGFNEYSEWTYIPTGNKYVILGTISKLYVLNTGVAAPLITTIDVQLNGTSATLSGAINDIGDSTTANCSVEYREEGIGDWYETTINEYLRTDDFPDTFSEVVYSFVLGTDYEYRTKCDYINSAGSYTTYGTTKTFTGAYPPFDPITAIRDNIFLVFGMLSLMGVIGFIANKGVTNPFVLLAVAVIGSFVLTTLQVFSLTISIFITLVCGLIGFVIILFNGGNN